MSSAPPLLALAFALGALSTAAPAGAATAKAALVEEVIPSKAWNFSARLLLPAEFARVFGPGKAGSLGITSITVTNTDSVARRVSFLTWGVDSANGDCIGNFLGIGSEIADVYVQARSTAHLTFPTAYVVAAIRGNTCIQVSSDPGANNVEIPFIVNGFIN